MNRSSRIWTKSVNSHAADIFSKFSFSPKAAETAFLAIFVDKINNNYSSSLWYYDSTLTVAVELINDKDMDLDSDLTIGNVTPRFSNDNDLIFLRLQKKLGWS